MLSGRYRYLIISFLDENKKVEIKDVKVKVNICNIKSGV